MNPELKGISAHAILRFKERTGAKYGVDKVIEKLTELYASAEPVVLKKKYIVVTLLNHNCEEAEYYKTGSFILVIVDGELRTIHKGEAHKWEPKTK